MQYHIWTLGCQMNVADSQRLASELGGSATMPPPPPTTRIFT